MHLNFLSVKMEYAGVKDMIQNCQTEFQVSSGGWADMKISFPLVWLFAASQLITWWSACAVNEDLKYCLHYFINT